MKNKLTRQEVIDRLTKLVSEQLCAGDITSESRFREDLGADSLDAVELIISVEEDFDIEIPDDDDCENKIQTVGEAVDYIFERVGK